MKTLKYALSFLLISNFLFSQLNSGNIIYKVLDIKRVYNYDSIFQTEKAIEYTKTLKFNLTFDQNRSNFSKQSTVKLVNVMDVLSTVDGTYCKSFEKNKIEWYCDYEEYGGKVAIENTNSINWKLLNTKKIISGYECYLAKGVFTNYGTRYVIECNLTAWYCPKIPLSIGPKFYYGLPGLIMEITDDRVTFGVSEINLDGNLTVKTISNEKEYKKITDKESQILMTNYIDKMLKK